MEGKSSEYTTTVQSIGCGGTGGDLTYMDSKDGKIVRIRPIHYLDKYTEEELAPSMWRLHDGKGHAMGPTRTACIPRTA